MPKKLDLELSRLQAKYPDAEIEVWSEDEHRLGLQPILRRVWTAIGVNVITRRIRFVFSASSRLQNYSRAVRLWPLTNEVIANHSPRSLDELEELLVVRCQKLLKQHDLIKGLTCYHWWPMTRTA